jgi:hypothetical protein
LAARDAFSSSFRASDGGFFSMFSIVSIISMFSSFALFGGELIILPGARARHVFHRFHVFHCSVPFGRFGD